MGERIHTAKWMVKSEDQRAKKRLSHFVFPKKPKKHMTFLISCKARSKKTAYRESQLSCKQGIF